jgi:phenylpropionate dioxygenase-like ring-hydroxylating dioxygenase large terminal subunit
MNFENLIDDYWHLAAHQSDLAKEGDFIKFQLISRTVVLYNDGADIIAFDNICPHRGTKFFLEPSGNSLAVCKYHGWAIARGALVIPSPDNYVDCPKKFTQYSIDYCGGYVFFGIEPKRRLIEQLTPEVYDLLEALSFDSENLVDINRYNYDCNALVAIENALEPDHVPFIHPNTLNPLRLINYQNEFYDFNSIVKFNIGNERIKKGLDRVGRIFSTSSSRFDGYMSIHLYPFSFISSTCGYSYALQNFFPLTENSTDFSSRLYFPNLVDEKFQNAASLFYESTSKVNREVFLEDYEICRRIDFMTWKRLLDGPLSLKEIKISAFRKNLKKEF